MASLYLQSMDNTALERFKPGQHLTFKLYVPGHDVPIFRNYSFSEAYNQNYYRISVKKEEPNGLCSSYLTELVKEGDILEAKGPMGDFYLDPHADAPVTLIAGGIGITPLLCMAKSISLGNPRRHIRFVYGVNGKNEHSFKQELFHLKQTYPNFKITTFYNEVSMTDIQGVDFDYQGLISPTAIAAHLYDATDYYICGPAPMLDFVREELVAAGVNATSVHTESFHSGLDSATTEQVLPSNSGTNAEIRTIRFCKSGKTFQWDSRFTSILEFAEANDIEISSGCLFGDCGTCLTTIQEGTIKYTHPTMVKPNTGECLPCSCVPTSNLILDA